MIRERGYERTTIEQVARRAGMTTGAIYGNFKNRDDLFIALGEAYWPPVKPQIPRGATFREAMHALAKATLAAADQRAPVAVGRLTGLAYAVKNRKLRARVLDVTRESYDAGVAWLRTFDPAELPMAPDALVRVIHVLIEGLVMQRILTPELCGDEVFDGAFAALARGSAGSTRHPTASARRAQHRGRT